MNSTPTPDAIVIGAGIVGAACAAELSAAGLRVSVLDSGFISGGTTGAGMGHVVVMDDSPAQIALTRLGLELWEAMRDDLPASCEWSAPGTLWLAEDDDELEAAREKERFYRSAGLRAEVVSGDELRKLEPAVREGLAGALRVPDDVVLYQPSATAHLLERVVEMGGSFRADTRVLEVVPNGVRTAGGTLSADVVVNAAGCASPELTPGLDVRPRRGHLAITARYPGLCTHELVELGYLKSAHVSESASVALNLQPRSTGQLLVGSSRDFETARRIDHDVLGRMLQRAVHFLPALSDLQVVRAWTGFRPATPDNLPLIGAWPEVPGLWIATGHEGLGITTATSTARLLGDLILGRAPSLDPEPYRAERNAA